MWDNTRAKRGILCQRWVLFLALLVPFAEPRPGHIAGEVYGEELAFPTDVRYEAAKHGVVYRLDAPAIVTIRAGIDGGPLLKNVLVGPSRPAGEHVEPWDGMDESGVVDVVSQKGFLLQGEAVSAAERDATVRWDARPSGTHEGLKLRIDLQGAMERTKAEVPFVAGKTSIEVSVDGPPDRDAGKPVHEIIFFVDFQFLRELEGESLPATLSWDTGEVGEGEHIITVNVVAPGGEVSTGSARVVVDNSRQ